MNNKVKGTQFEQRICKMLAGDGYWVHFISPDNRGAQPFDIIAVKDGLALAADCKTCDAKSLSISRLEDNQIMAFDKWLACGNLEPVLFVEHEDEVYVVKYLELKQNGKVILDENHH